MEPILNYEERIRNEIKPEIRHAKAKKEILKKRLTEFKKKINSVKKQKNDKNFKKIYELSDKIAEMNIPTLLRLVASDITSEKLAVLMSENNGRIATLSPEGDLFKLMAGRYTNNGTNFENFKKAWTGGEPIRDDRMGRKGTYVKNPCLTQGITVQPVILKDLSNKKAFKGEGLLGRFLFVIPESPVGKRKTGFDVPDLNTLAKARYNKGLTLLLNTKPASTNNFGNWKPHILQLSTGALQVKNHFEAVIEKKLKEGCELYYISDWGGKLVGQTIRIAGLLHITNQISFRNNKIVHESFWNKKISKESMESAITLGQALIPHAIKTYNLIDEKPEISLTRYVLKRIVKGKELERKRKLKYEKKYFDKSVLMEMCKGKKEIQKPSDLNKPLSLLRELNYIKIIKRKTNKPGRNPSPLIKLNPKVNI